MTGDSKNFMHYSNAEYDETFQKAYTAVDEAEKAAFYKEAQMILAEDAASVYIQDPANFCGGKQGVCRIYLLSDRRRRYVSGIPDKLGL